MFAVLRVTLKVELEVIPLRWLQESKAVLDSCAYNSLLTLTVDEQQKRSPQIYMFQCEETGVSQNFDVPEVSKVGVMGWGGAVSNERGCWEGVWFKWGLLYQAELIKADLDKIIKYKDGRDNGGVEPRGDQSDIK